jgi:hypothetical protein
MIFCIYVLRIFQNLYPSDADLRHLFIFQIYKDHKNKNMMMPAKRELCVWGKDKPCERKQKLGLTRWLSLPSPSAAPPTTPTTTISDPQP